MDKPEELILVKTLADLKKLQEYLAPFEYIAFDTETTGLSRESEIIGFSVCAEMHKAYYVILAVWDAERNKLNYLETREGAKEFLSTLVGKSLIAHNAVFDCWKVEVQYGLNLIDSVHTDTMLLAHLIDENRSCGLKELSVTIFGEDSIEEQREMKESVAKNGGQLTKANYELYKADADIVGKYGAKDTILTLKLFNHLVPQLFDQGLDKFFYDDETMPLLRTATYDLNTVGLKVDVKTLEQLKATLEAECAEAEAIIDAEVAPFIKDKYPGTNKLNTFNIGSNNQIAWLLFKVLRNYFATLTDGGRELCHHFNLRIPYTNQAKREFMEFCERNKDTQYSIFNMKTRKPVNKKVKDFWTYTKCDAAILKHYAPKYRWVEKLLIYKKNEKILGTYISAVQEQMQYGIIRPSFLQHGTTSGRYSSARPNFQNLPRDKRVKSFIVSRPGKVFVGADYSQIEPRIFASYSEDRRLLDCFKNGDDFYSVIGVEVYNKPECSIKKDGENAFAVKYPDLREIAKKVALSATYGTTAFKMASLIESTTDEAQDVINAYFYKFASVKKFMLRQHQQVKEHGVVYNLFGRPRRLPDGLKIGQHDAHEDLQYTQRKTLNLSVNHAIQSTAASIMNRAAIRCMRKCKELGYLDVRLVLSVHDELILECSEEIAPKIVQVLKEAMENAVELPGVSLIAEPKIGKSLSELK